MPVTRSRSYLFDYEELLTDSPDGFSIPTLAMEDRVPVGKYCVVGDTTRSLSELAGLASSLNLAGYVFELGEATESPLRWSPSAQGSGWKRNQGILFEDRAPFFANNGEFYGPQTLRAEDRIVVGAKFYLGEFAVRNPANVATEAARISNILDLDFVVLDVTDDAWLVANAGDILLTLVTQVLDYMRRPALAPLMPRISHYKPVFIVFPPRVSDNPNFLNNDGSVEVFSNGFTSGKAFPLPKVSATAPSSVQDRWEWARPPSLSDKGLISRAELFVDAKGGIGSTSSLVTAATSEASVALQGMSWTVKSGFILVDDIDTISAYGSFPGNDPDKYWDYDEQFVDGSFVMSIFPYPIPPATVRNEFAYKLSPWGFPDDEGTERDLFVVFENWKTGNRPSIVTLYDHACDGYQTLSGKWIRINGRYLRSLPAILPMEANGFSISGYPILGDEGYYPFLFQLVGEGGGDKTELSFTIPVYNQLSEYTVPINTPALDYSAPILVHHPPRYNMRRAPQEWSPVEDWCQQRAIFQKTPYVRNYDARAIPTDTDNDPNVGEAWDRAPQDAQTYISRYFPPSQWENAAIVGECESGWDSSAHALTAAEDSRGWFQINVIENGTLGDGWVEYADEDLYDAETNTRIAAAIWTVAGWQPWSCAATHGLDLSVPSLDAGGTSSIGILGWTYPTASVRVTAGCNWHEQKEGIPAIDIGALDPGVAGDELYAVDDGTILYYGWDDSYAENSTSGYGIKVEIAMHENESVVVRYGHLHPDSLSLFSFKTGDVVAKGDVIGLMGTTGNSSGPHVHVEVLIDGVRVCPDKYLPLL